MLSAEVHTCTAVSYQRKRDQRADVQGMCPMLRRSPTCIADGLRIDLLGSGQSVIQHRPILQANPSLKVDISPSAEDVLQDASASLPAWRRPCNRLKFVERC